MVSNGWELEDENKLNAQLNKDLEKIFDSDIQSIQIETKLVRNLSLLIFFMSLIGLSYLAISFHEILKIVLSGIGVTFVVSIVVLVFLMIKSKKMA